MRPFFGPLHLLFFAESSAHHFVHRRFHKSRRDRLTVTISLTVIRDQVPVVPDIRAQLHQRLDQSSVSGIRLLEGLNRDLQSVDLTQSFVYLTVPKRPFETVNLLTNRFTQHGVAMDQTFAVESMEMLGVTSKLRLR